MSVRIKVSYEADQELQHIINLLRPVIKQCKKAEKQGKYNRAYIMIDVKKK